MKNKLKSVFSIVFLTFLMFGFETNAQKTSIGQNELPAAANEFLKQHYSNDKATVIIKDKEVFSTDYEVKLSNGVEIEFDKNGNWKEIDGNGNEIHGSLILQPIKEYLAKNYAGQKVLKIEKGLNLYELELSSGIELKFDKKGYFVKID